MKELFKGKAKKPGLPPGSVVFTGDQIAAPPTLSVFNYNDETCEERVVKTVDEWTDFRDERTVSWLNVNGVHDVSIVQRVGELVDLHPLVMEDVVNLDQRPKLEDFEQYLFVVLKMIHYDEEYDLKIEQVSLIVGPTHVVSFQEHEGDVFEPIRHRIRTRSGRIRRMGTDYLAYALIDIIVDHYFSIVEQTGEEISRLEERLVNRPDKGDLVLINDLKREVTLFRKSIWPLREVVSGLQRSESALIKSQTEVFLSDVYDHTIQALDMAETLRDLLSSLTDLYMSSLSQKMNEVMQFLTIVGAIFIPLTFIAGVYGMNFSRMPELGWPYGYPTVLLLMLLIGVGLLAYFKHKKWL